MKKLVQSLFVLLLIASTVLAQDRRITGKVTASEDGLPLPGVSVKVVGTNQGTQTDANGNFTINVPTNSKSLEISYIGFVNQIITIGAKTNFNVSLVNDTKALSEVVVVGYSTTTQQAFTGSAKVISNENLERKAVSNISQALSGEVSGVNVINTSGQPGTTATIRVRGFGSVNGNRDPLYVVDGAPIVSNTVNTVNPLSAINPDDIDNVTILKDAAATAIYGSRGANGVVLITTKSGKGKPSFIEVNGQTGTNKQILPRYDVIKSPEQYIGLVWEGLYNEAAANGASNPTNTANSRLFNSNYSVSSKYNMWNVSNGADLIDPTTRTVKPGVTRKYDPENWEDYGFQNSSRNEANIKFGGSNDATNYYSSFGYLNDVGYSVGSDYKRLSGRLNLNQKIKSWITGSINLGYSKSTTNRGGQSEDSGSIFWFADNIPSIYPLFLRDATGAFVSDPIFGGNQYDYGVGRGFGALTNAIADATYDIQRDKRNDLNGVGSLKFDLAKGLTFETRLGIQYYNNIYNLRNNKYYGSAAGQNGSLFQRRTELESNNFLNLLRYTKTLGEHNFEILAAHESTDYRLNVAAFSSYNLVDPDILDFNNAVVSNPNSSYTNAYKLDSYFSQLNYNYKSTYYLSGSIRRDGSSRFVRNKWGTFGSMGAAWILSNESFMEQAKQLFPYLKLKTSYGLIGDQEGVGFYPGYDLYSINNLDDNPALSFDTKGNPDLTWETAKIFQTGVEFDLKKYISGSVDYYIKNTDDLIFDRRVGPSIGYALIKVNGGKLRNQGLEFDLTGHILKTNDYRLDLTVNGALYKNKLTEMPIDPVTGKQKPLDIQAPYAYSVGHSIYDFYMRNFAGVDPADGLSTWTRYYNDANNNGSIDTGEGITSLSQYLADNPSVNQSDLKTTTTKTYANATQYYVGKSSIPKVRGAVNLSAGYKSFDLGVQMLYNLGGYSYDYAYASLMSNDAVGSNNWSTDILNRWQKAGDVTDVPRISNDNDPNVSSLSTRFITKANYLILNNVRLSYELPKNYLSKVGLAGCSLWVSGDNLWIHSARDGFNPMISESGESDIYTYSPLSTLTLGLKVKL
nr:SusC/RagA family TonB-linked outer membrane protein [uncultured Pedobacter sp.]